MIFRSAIAFLMSMLLRPEAALAEKRVALVIGNGAYLNVGRLSNPARDADAMEALFRAASFDVVEVKRDLSAISMRRALRDFADRVRDADIAVVFYAGHGIEVNGTNYLIPVDATLERDLDVEDEAISLERVMLILEQAKRLRLVILDACRDNPFVRSMRRTIAGRSIGRGLAEVRVLTADTLIAFAAKAGFTAADGQGTNSPYTTALVKHLPTTGLDVRLALGRVRDEVLKSTRNGQEPFVYGSLGGAEIALVSAITPQPQVLPQALPPQASLQPPATPPWGEAERAWAAIKDSKDKRDFDAFRRQYGNVNSFYDGLAERRIDQLNKQAAAPMPSPPPPMPSYSQNVKLFRVMASVSQGVHNMRSGPGVDHPLVTAIPANSSGVAITVNTCRSADDGRSTQQWCHGRWRNFQGWVSMGGLIGE